MRKEAVGFSYDRTPKAKINGSSAIAGVTPKPSESYQRAVVANSTARCHVHTNCHYHVEGMLTAVTQRAKDDGKCGILHANFC